MKFLLISLLFVKLQLINSMTVKQNSLEDTEPASLKSNEQYSDEEMEYFNEKSSADLCSQDRNGNQKCSSSVKGDNGIHEEQPLPLPYLRIPNDVALTQYSSQPAIKWNKPWGGTAYEVDNSANSLPLVPLGTYNGVQYPYVNPNLFASMNRLPPVSYLPPVASIYVHESLPAQDQQTFLSRPVRVVHSKDEEDFLAELSHRAIMNNIIPTIPVPFIRSSYPDQISYGPSQIAMFPYAAPDCALPIMLSCFPKINHGILGQRVYRKHPYRIPPLPEKAYQKDAEPIYASDTSPMKNEDKKPQLLNSNSTKNPIKHTDVEEHKFVPNLKEKQHMLKMKNLDDKQSLIKQVGKEQKNS